MLRIQKRFILLTYPFVDGVISGLVWYLFWLFRKIYFEGTGYPITTWREIVLLIGVSIGWVSLLWLGGAYERILKTSLLRQVLNLFQLSLLGSVALFFVTYIDDPIQSYTQLRSMFLLYWGMQFGALLFSRVFYTLIIRYYVRRGWLRFATLIIGQGKKALNIWHKINSSRYTSGHHIVGYVKVPTQGKNYFLGKLKRIAFLEDLQNAIRRRNIEEVIIALEADEHELFMEVIRQAQDLPVNVNVVPDLYDYFIGNVRVTKILDELPLVEVYPKLLSTREQMIKRGIDVVVSLTMLILCMPLFALLALLIKLDSRGPVFYSQTRIGKDGKPFTIYKFRSMYVDAEKHGPALASDNDPRITRVGRWLRKMRLDEFPQFYNVLIGDMSLVGPRPERYYFIKQIVKRAPEYWHLLKVRPGITSLGQVKFGYAENVDQMIERMRFDLLYIEKFSLALDFKIMLRTFLVVVEGRGK